MNRFVPVRVADLVDHLEEDFFLDDASRRDFRHLTNIGGQLLRHFAHQRTAALRRVYGVFDPDSETLPLISQREASRLGEFFEGLDALFLDAGFERLDDDDFHELAQDTTTVKVKVKLNLQKIERFSLYHRGEGHKAQVVRPIKQLFKRFEIEIPTYTRVAVISRTLQDPHIGLEIYKDVAKDDVELLLPTIDIKMKLLDQLKLSGASGSAFISAVKLLRTLFLQVPKLIALPFKVVLLPLILIVTLVYGGKAFLDYSKIRQQYLDALRENLHNLQLARNDSVLPLLGAYLSEESTKRLLLAYVFLYKSGVGLAEGELARAVDAYTRRAFVTSATFDEPRALALLDELGLLRQHDGKHRVIPLDEALRTIDQVWDELYEAPRKPDSATA